MRHFVGLGVRGILLEIGVILMRLQGSIVYRWMLYRRRDPSAQHKIAA